MEAEIGERLETVEKNPVPRRGEEREGCGE